MKIIGTERDYQRYIIDYLIDNNGYIERKCKTNYDRTTAMDRELLFRFLDTTQPDTMAALRKIYNGQTEETIVKFILQSIDNKCWACSCTRFIRNCGSSHKRRVWQSTTKLTA